MLSPVLTTFTVSFFGSVVVVSGFTAGVVVPGVVGVLGFVGVSGSVTTGVVVCV